jgi:2-hydroxychromene-2-carboxylate isomerase
MAVTIEYYYSYQSPYSYLALDAVYDLEATFDIDMLWQPFSAKASGEQVNAGQVVPDKLSYLFEDTKRMASEMGIPLNFPEGWPDTEFDPGRVTRGALIARDLGFLKEYNYKVFQKWWGNGENPNEQDFMNELCEDLDIDIGDFLSKTSASDTRERVKGIYKRGRKHGIFDTPTFLIAEERVYGIDRMAYLRDRLTKMGLKKKGR